MSSEGQSCRCMLGAFLGQPQRPEPIVRLVLVRCEQISIVLRASCHICMASPGLRRSTMLLTLKIPSRTPHLCTPNGACCEQDAAGLNSDKAHVVDGQQRLSGVWVQSQPYLHYLAHTEQPLS